MSSQNRSAEYRHACDIVWKDIDGLRNTFSLSWRKIACTPKYQGIPAGTLCAFYKGKREIPIEYRAQLGIPYELPAPACAECGIVHIGACPKKRKPRVYRSLFDWPVKELARALENREVLQASK